MSEQQQDRTEQDRINEAQGGINAQQGGINAQQGSLNETQGHINDAQGDLNVDYFHDGDEAILVAIDTFRTEATRLSTAIKIEATARIERDATVDRLFKRVSKLFAATAVALVVLVAMGGYVYKVQHDYNHDRCLVGQKSRRTVREANITLVRFTVNAFETKDNKANLEKFVSDYRVQAFRDLPDLHC